MKLISMVLVAFAAQFLPATAYAQASAAENMADEKLYFHAYQRPLVGSFQLQPGQGFALVEPFAGVVRMIQICVRDAKSTGQMPVPTPMLATRRTLSGADTFGSVPVGGCSVIEGEGVYVGLADGTTDTDISNENTRKQLALMTGNYTILGYYSNTPPAPAHMPKVGSETQ